MEKKSDSKLIALYQSRSEIAISETKSMYGRLIYSVAHDLLKNNSDAEECENDTYLGLQKSIPPAEPKNFKAFCLKITRNLALKKLDYYSAEKRDFTKTIYYEDVLNEISDLEFHLRDDKESDLSQCIDEFLVISQGSQTQRVSSNTIRIRLYISFIHKYDEEISGLLERQ